jgi:hypothetical protein
MAYQAQRCCESIESYGANSIVIRYVPDLLQHTKVQATLGKASEGTISSYNAMSLNIRERE